jgi:Tol biopolymer transport system component
MVRVRNPFTLLTLLAAMMALLCAMAGSSAAAGGDTTLVSVADSSGTQADRESANSSITPDGRYVAFVSNATNLVTGDTNNVYDVFVRDLQTGATERVSVNSSETQQSDLTTNNLNEGFPSISSDGRFVAFASSAKNLVPNDTNGYRDVFVRDRQEGTTERVSISNSGVQATGGFPGTTEPSGSRYPSISADGRFVAFSSNATNLVSNDTNDYEDTFVRDRQEGTTERVSVDSSETQTSHSFSSDPSISSDGRFVAFQSASPNLVENDTNATLDVFVRDRQEGTTERVSVNSSGAQANNGSGTWADRAISADGRFVAFTSAATNLVLGDTNGYADLFVYDRQAETTRRVSLSSSGTQANGDTEYPTISPDGRFVAFHSSPLRGATNLVKNDTNNAADVFVRDMQTGTTARVSIADSSGAQANSFSSRPSISSDGRYTTFTSGATNLVKNDTNNNYDVFVHKLDALPDSGTPMVERVVPAHKTTGAARDANLMASFSEEMKPESISRSTFKFYKWNRKTRTWRRITDVEITCDSPCLEAVLNPYPSDDLKLLAARTKYKADLTTGVTDKAGNALARNVAWTFSTGAE